MTEATRILAPRDDGTLIRAIARGDAGAMETLYRAHADAVFRFAYRRTGESYQDAEEITQDTFLTVLDLAETFKGESSAYVWLCGIARLRLIDFYRRQNREKRAPKNLSLELHDEVASKENIAASVEGRIAEAIIVDRLAQVLSDEEKEAFMMRHVDGFSLEEISSVLSRSLRATEGIVYRAKQKLRAAIIDGRVESLSE